LRKKDRTETWNMQRKTIVGVDVRDLQISKSGVKTYLEELCKEFAKPDEAIEFFFIRNRIPVYTGSNPWGKLLEHFRFQLWKQIILPIKAKWKGCDIMFCTDFFVPVFSWGIKTVPVFHDAFFWEYPHHYNQYWRTLFIQLGLRAAKKSAFIITPTKYTQEQIAHYSGIAREKIIPIHEGPKRFEGSQNANPIGKPYILHIGTAEKRKNLPFLIKAFHELINTADVTIPPHLCLVLAGQFTNKSTINDAPAIMATIEALALNDRVILTGYLPDEAIPAYYTHAACYVFPSLNEGFGIPILEAFQYGTPVLIANNSCLPEVAGDAALTFDPTDQAALVAQLKTILTNQILRETLIAKGKERVKQFTWESAAAEIKALFKQAYNTKL
jgi:glycosyltransferase involved in cell wall biosynthesis